MLMHPKALFALQFLSVMSLLFQKNYNKNPFCRDGGGTIDSSEVTEMLKGLFSMAGVSHIFSYPFDIQLHST